MGRPPRIELANGTYHLTSRGSNRQQIYASGAYHLVVQIAEGDLSSGMQWLNGAFSRITNQQQGREAHLFRNRFASRLIESDAHLLAACRYVVLNPVAAGLCARPEDWEWSSYRATAGLDPSPAFLADKDVLRRFAPSADEARRLYREFVAEGVGALRAAAIASVCDTPVSVSDTAAGVQK
jgi:REP element-mobilizing transposase RayT